MLPLTWLPREENKDINLKDPRRINGFEPGVTAQINPLTGLYPGIIWTIPQGILWELPERTPQAQTIPQQIRVGYNLGDGGILWEISHMTYKLAI